MVNGIVLIDKERGYTSRKVDNVLGKRFLTHSVGHLGTLDPFATGLLIVAIGKGTKLLPYIEDGDKTYEATLVLGKKTSTGDPEGEVIEEKEIPEITKEKLDEVLASFLGESEQVPPMYSAIKINGVPMYKAARKGEVVELKPRKITVHEISGSIEGNEIRFVAKVSKGTYIRVLGEDIASKLGTVGFLSSLRRTSIGDIDVKDAKHIDDVLDEDIVEGTSFINLPKLSLNETAKAKAMNGVKLHLNTKHDKVLLVYENSLVAVYVRKEENVFVSERGLF
ncbi:MAG: tRNA pseudouridine(55) synthase TruB [Bacilli bacterium]|nr:tRNA pseudouridine(55) synthase TruB [Bacilli bacterium]